MKSNRQKNVYLIITMSALFTSLSYAAGGYFQLHNLMSAANKTIPANRYMNDTDLNLENQEQGSGHVVNTQFSNDGGVAGCGISSTLMQYMYQVASTRPGNTIDRSNNYIALNVYSQIFGFNPQAPFWGDPEGQVKGYLTPAGTTNVAYSSMPYHRILPSLYPAYLGTFNNGLNCGRWVQANFDTQHCLDRTSSTGISKSCPSVSNLTYTGENFQGYVFDSCEDNNGWCRDDAAHIDVNPKAFTVPDNYYLQWKFIRNPYYADTSAPTYLKDIWLAWFNQASKYWSYLAILNAENGLSTLQYNIGGLNNPTWINSHYLGGNNDLTWSSTSSDGQLWQVEPMNALTDANPPNNPSYEIRLFDYLGYPANHGAIYQFSLFFQDGTLGQEVGGFSFFYQGGLAIKTGSQTQNMVIHTAPAGTGSITVDFGTLLPSNVSLVSTQTNYLRPVLISDAGYSYDAAQCSTTNTCVFTQLPTGAIYHVFAHFIDEQSNDLTLRKVNDVGIYSSDMHFTAGGSTSINYTLKAGDLNLSTLYAARVIVPLQFAATSQTTINANLQALFIPNVSKNVTNHITAQTQGCFLNNYVTAMTTGSANNTSICTVYYTVNNQTNFESTPPTAYFNVMLPNQVGFSPINYYLAAPYYNPVQITGYTANGTPTSVSVPTGNYLQSTNTTRSMYFILDPNSDSSCLKNLDPTKGVSVTVGNATPIILNQADQPVETYIPNGVSSLTGQPNMASSSTVSCQAQFAIVPPFNPGIDTVNVVKLVAIPQVAPLPPATQGIAATAAGDATCLGGNDILTFTNSSSAAATANYTVSNTATNVGIYSGSGTYTISDQAFNVIGGSCQLATHPSVVITDNTFTPISLNYQFTASPSATCSVKVNVSGTWPNGCGVQFTVNSTSSISNVTIFWPKGAWSWSNAQPYGGEGSLTIPAGSGNVSWALPSWVQSGSSVGMNVNNDGTPSICSAFANTSSGLTVSCTGTTS